MVNLMPLPYGKDKQMILWYADVFKLGYKFIVYAWWG